MLSKRACLVPSAQTKLKKKKEDAEHEGKNADVEAIEEEMAFAELQLEGAKVIVDNEHAGKKHYGKRAVVKEVEGDEAVVDFEPVVDRLKVEVLTPVAELANLKELKKLAGLNSLTRGLCRDLLEKVG